MTILQVYFWQNRDEVLDNLSAFVCTIWQIHKNYCINGPGKKSCPMDQFKTYSCEKALNYFCILYSRSLHFLQNHQRGFFVQAWSLSKDVSFYLIFLRNLMDICCLFSMPFLSSNILSTLTFSFLDSSLKPNFPKKERD